MFAGILVAADDSALGSKLSSQEPLVVFAPMSALRYSNLCISCKTVDDCRGIVARVHANYSGLINLLSEDKDAHATNHTDEADQHDGHLGTYRFLSWRGKSVRHAEHQCSVEHGLLESALLVYQPGQHEELPEPSALRD